MNENIKAKKKRQKRLINYTLVGPEENYFCALEESVRNLNNLILQTKLYYQQNLGKKLNDPTLQSKRIDSYQKVSIMAFCY